MNRVYPGVARACKYDLSRFHAQTLPEAYLADAHLKYLGWALSDKDAAVRLAAVSGVSDLYRSRENVFALREFKSRFEVRFREMVLDVDGEVAVAAVRGMIGSDASCIMNGRMIARGLVSRARRGFDSSPLNQVGLLSRLVEAGEMDKEAMRSDVYFLLGGPVPELRLAASELVATLLLDASEQHAKVWWNE